VDVSLKLEFLSGNLKCYGSRGLFRGGKPDKEIFEEGLGPKIPAGKLAIL
jgi:hypothetical protein